MKKNNLQLLLAEKQRIRSIVKLQEEELKERATFFESNYKGIIWSKINPFKGNVTINGVVNYAIKDLLPLITGLDGGNKHYSVGSKLLAKGIRYTLLNSGINLLKKFWENKEEKKEND
jgi:hypothetical protein